MRNLREAMKELQKIRANLTVAWVECGRLLDGVESVEFYFLAVESHATGVNHHFQPRKYEEPRNVIGMSQTWAAPAAPVGKPQAHHFEHAIVHQGDW